MSIVHDSPASMEVAELRASAQWAGDSYFIHFDLCRARKAGLDCLKCQQLQSVADAAEQRLDAAFALEVQP